MATPFESLQKEVRTLRREIRRLKGNPDANQKAVDALVNNDQTNHEAPGQHNSGGFARLAAGVREQGHKNNLRAAEDFARAKLPSTPNLDYLKEQIFTTFGLAGADLDQVITRARERA